jgi:hypothetical protein
MKTLFVRVQPKTGATVFHRCAIKFTQDWQEVTVDDATARRLQAEQMLEVSETRPAAPEDNATAGDSAATVSAAGSNSDTPATAPSSAASEVAAPVDVVAAAADAAQAPEAAIETGAPETAAPEVETPAELVKPIDPDALVSAIRAAIATLDPADAALWTAQGKAKLDAIGSVTGWPVTAAERDAAQAAAEPL